MGPAKETELDKLPKEYRNNFTLDNAGNLVYKNRAYRRGKQPTDNWDTKSSHAIQTKRRRIRERMLYERRQDNRSRRAARVDND